MRKLASLGLLATAVTIAGIGAQPVVATPPGGPDFIGHIAQSRGIAAAKLEVADEVAITFENSGRKATVAKVLNSETGEAFVAAFDETGKEIDLAAARDDDAAAFRKGGKLSAGLRTRLNAVGANDAGPRIPVAIWVDPGELPGVRPDAAEPGFAAAHAAHLQNLESRMQAALAGVKADIGKAGANARSGKLSPTVFASLTPGQIRQLARRSDVAAIYEQESFRLFSDDSGTTMRSHRVWAAGNFGAGVASRLAVHEPDGVYPHQDLDNISHPVIYFCSDVNALCPSGKNLDNHASGVAGVMAGTHPLYRGGASNAQVILSANSNTFDDADLVDAFEWAVGNGAGVINLSWGTVCPSGGQTYWSQYADWAVRNLWVTQTISSGNTTGCATGDLNVSAPGIAWSVITVGAIDDADSGFWSGDAMASFSRYVDPLTGQDKPEVVSVGVDVTAPVADPTNYGIWNGTSFSAPNVAGVVGQMLSRQPGLRIWPETIKAATMVSAMHDIEAGTDRDGVGAVVATVADDTMKNATFAGLSVTTANMTESCAPVSGSVCMARNVSLTKGKRTRIAIAYDAVANPGVSDALGADLDLYVVSPSSTLVATSASISNAWEMVDFTPSVTGTYKVLIRRYSSDASWPGSYLGMAWGIGTTGSTATATLPDFCAGSKSTSVGSLGTKTITMDATYGGTYFDSYVGWAPNQSGREAVYKVTLSTVRDLTFRDDNPNMDLHLVQLTNGCSGNPITYNAFLHTANGPTTVQNLPPGTYYLIADGLNGAVGSTKVTITTAGP